MKAEVSSVVILSHSPELVDGNRKRELLTNLFHTLTFGEVGVAGFFIISGYLISQSWERSANLGDYLKRRVLRIYPGFIVAATATAFLFGPAGADRAQYFRDFSLGTFVKSALLLSTPGIPATNIGNGALWTIQSEFACYLLVAALGILDVTRRRACAPLMFIPVALLFIKKGVIFAPFNFLGFFLAGATLYHFRDRVRYTVVGSLVALTLLLPAMMFHRVTAWFGLCTAGAYLLFAFAFFPIRPLQTIAQRADISYGTYLYGWPIQCSIIMAWPAISPWILLPSPFRSACAAAG